MTRPGVGSTQTGRDHDTDRWGRVTCQRAVDTPATGVEGCRAGSGNALGRPAPPSWGFAAARPARLGTGVSWKRCVSGGAGAVQTASEVMFGWRPASGGRSESPAGPSASKRRLHV